MMRGTLGLPMILSLDIISDWLVGLAHVAVRSRECMCVARGEKDLFLTRLVLFMLFMQ